MRSYCTIYTYKTDTDFIKDTTTACFGTMFDDIDGNNPTIIEVNIFLLEGIGGNISSHNFDYSKEKVEEILTLFSNLLPPYVVSVETNLLENIGRFAQSNLEDFEYDYSKRCLKVSFDTTGLTIGHMKFFTTLIRYMYETDYKEVLDRMLEWRKFPELSNVPPIELLQHAHSNRYYGAGHCLLFIDRREGVQFTTVISKEQLLRDLKNKNIKYVNTGLECLFNKKWFKQEFFEDIDAYLTYLKEKFK